MLPGNREPQQTGDTLILTKKGKHVAEVKGIKRQKKDDIFGFMKGKGRITGDIV
jgi:antitoxin (DNA-binding transcriptional repressor) of toxin-antitoxin stability system